MLKREFEERVQMEIPEEFYEMVEVVYMNYPGIQDKDEIATLFKIGGETLIKDMYPRAKEIQKAETALSRIRKGVEEFEQEVIQMRKGLL